VRRPGARSLVAVLALPVLAFAGCASNPHVIIATGTTLGIKATPGDGQTRPPQLVVGYKRAEVAVIPVDATGAQRDDARVVQKEAASTVASFYMKNTWTSETVIRSFIGTGFAARSVVEKPAFQEEMSRAVQTARQPAAALREMLKAHWAALNGDEARAQKILDLAEYPRKTARSAVESLRDYIEGAGTAAALARLASAFNRVP
jgi:hypothetical protein